jgi:hypothetical protein
MGIADVTTFNLDAYGFWAVASGAETQRIPSATALRKAFFIGCKDTGSIVGFKGISRG